MHRLRQYVKSILVEAIQDVVAGKKMIFMAGAPGSGKSTVLKQLGLVNRFAIINPDDWYEPFLQEAGISLDVGGFTQKYFDIMSAIRAGQEAGLDISELNIQRAKLRPTMSQNMKLFSKARKLAAEEAAKRSTEGSDFIIDGTGGNYKQIANLNNAYIKMGYETAMIYVTIPLETSQERNFQRGEAGKRRIHSRAVEKSWTSVSGNEQAYSELYGENFFSIDNSGSFEDYQLSIESIRNEMDRFLS
jgi:adenylate kinase family enzyme